MFQQLLLIAVVVGLLIRALPVGRWMQRQRHDNGLEIDSSQPDPQEKEKEGKPRSTLDADQLQDYSTVFPPSRREYLRDSASNLNCDLQPAFDDSISLASLESSLLPLGQDYRQADGSRYIYSGFSIREIKALGDFPDYAHLCGVPLPEPYHTFNIEQSLPRPYRPFRWAYHQTMSLAKMDTNFWLELENTYRTRIAERKKLYAQHSENVLQWLPGSELACKELMEMALQFLCARYPHYFQLTPEKGDKSRMILENRIFNTREVVQDRHPLLVLLDHIPEDFAIMLRRPNDGGYVFRAGIICSALGWNVATKINKRLHEIHEPVPDYREKLRFSMDRYFAKMPTDKPIQRTSWGLEVGQPLYVPPGDPHEEIRTMQLPELTPDRIHLRTDHQTLRRLPLSGAVVFNFKALFTPMTEFRDEPYIPSLVLHVCRNAKQNLLDYKATWHVEHVALPALEGYEREQIAKGLIPSTWEVQTLDEHPFYPGWEKKWCREQD